MLASVWCVIAASAGAQSQNEEATRAMARSLFHEGVACLDAGDHACAVDRFRRSIELQPSPVVSYNLAAAEQELGHVAVAAEIFLGVSRDSSAPAEVREAASAAHDEVRPRVAYLVVQANALHGATVSVGSMVIPEPGMGVRVPIDPGAGEVLAMREGVELQRVPFEAVSGEATEVRLEIEPAAVPTPAETARRAPPESEVPPERSRPTGRRVAIALAVVALVAGGVALAFALSGKDPAQPLPGSAGVLEIGP